MLGPNESIDAVDTYHGKYNELSDGSVLKVSLLNDGKAPIRTSMFAAGFDLFASKECLIYPNESAVVTSGVIIEPPRGTYARIAPKSGLSKKFIVNAGVVDWDYRGEIKVLLYNISKDRLVIEKGQAVAQLILEKIAMPNLELSSTLVSTHRNAQGGVNRLESAE